MFENFIGNYDVSKYPKYPGGFDPKFEDDDTNELVDAIKDYYIAGYKKFTIIKDLVKLGMTRYSASFLATKAWKDIVIDGKKRKDNMLEKNIQRLEWMYGKAAQDGNIKVCNQVVDTLNKLCGLYREKVEITTDEYMIDLLGDGKKKDKD